MLIDDFHNMEKKAELFGLTDHNKIPIWDVLRYHVYLKYYYPEIDMKIFDQTSSRTWKDYIKFCTHCFRFIFYILFVPKKGTYLIQTASRYKKDKNYFDKFAQPLINELESDCIILETYTLNKTEHHSLYDLSYVFRRLYKKEKLSEEIYKQIYRALIEQFGCCKISYEELNKVYHCFLSDLFFYDCLIKRLRPKKIFISTGNPKAIVWSAKKYNIETCLFQHAGIMYEEAEYSYPLSITRDSNVIFADYLLTFGSYWGKNMNIPVKQIVCIGNDSFYKKDKVRNSHQDAIILVVSTIVHGQHLSELTHIYAKKHPQIKFQFKLHPNEFHKKNFYNSLFEDTPNVNTILDEKDTSDLLYEAKLVILIVSTVIFEALDINRKVAVYKQLNYDRNNSLAFHPNVYFFDSDEELDKILAYSASDHNTKEMFYSPLNLDLLKTFL